jgi:diguanylate cyclase (GGDEF)-like protein/PAS domain S-box-containing protein
VPHADQSATLPLVRRWPTDGPHFELGIHGRTLLLLAVPLVGIPIVLAAVGAGGQGPIWARLHLTIAAILALAISVLGCHNEVGRARAVRGWIAFAFAAWLGVVLVRDLELAGWLPLVPFDLGLVLVAVGVIGAYRAALRGRLGRSPELNIYLDAAIVFAAVAAGLIAIRGAGAIGDRDYMSLLLRALLALGALAATAILTLALHAPRRFSGPYAVLVGLALVGVGFIARTGSSDAFGPWPFTTLISVGLLIVAFGTATWTEASDDDTTYARIAQQVRDLLPLAAFAVVPFVLLPAEIVAVDLPLRIVINAAIGFIVVGAVVRQRRLLRDRDRVVGETGTALDALVDEKDFIAAILEAVGAIVIVVGADGRLARYNAAASVVSGYSPAEIDAHGSLDFLVPPDQRRAVLNDLGRVEAGGPGSQRENEWVRKDGSRRHIAWSNTAVLDGHDVVRYTIATGIDITDRKNLEDELAHKALHDALTGLPNRRLLMDRLEHALQSRRGAATSLLFLDLDDFKTVNDRFGHEVGDEVLKVIAERLVDVVRPGDTVSRLSGDEFAIVLEEPMSGNAPDLVATRILEAVARPVEVRGHPLALTVSIGSAVVETSATTAAELLRNADFAMYAAKLAGRAQYRPYEAQDRAAADDDARLAADLPGAIARGELRVHYQPIVDLRSGTVGGLEALVRWQHPERGLLAPGLFIPIAERSGSIVEIGGWVLDTACRALKIWQHDLPTLSMAVNLSGRQLESPQLMGHVRETLAEHGIAPASLILEVTETILVRDPTSVAKLDALKALGVRLAIDDFGTGYSSISYLRRFPVDILKIDREFTDGADSPEGLKLLRGIAQLGRMVGLELIAEGIERAEQIGPIIEAGCDEGQGFLFARPVDAERMTKLLRGGSLWPMTAVADQPAVVAPRV